jgi:hypothetical protein
MADSDLSASELRQRYHKGGSVPDSELSASQLRARHGVARNAADFSTQHNKGSNAGLVIGALVALGLGAVAALVWVFLLKKSI